MSKNNSEREAVRHAMAARTSAQMSPAEAKGDCTICKGWVDDGRGGTCVFTDDFWVPHCPYDKEAF